MNVEITWEDMHRRNEAIPKMLSYISDDRSLFLHPVSVATRYTIGVHDRKYDGTNDYTRWRFKTIVPQLRANYYERWSIMSQGNVICLERAYLNIYRVSGPTDEKEFLCLHCDPNEDESAKHWRYKRSPHLHVKEAPTPFPKSHIALALANLDDVLTSADNFQKALDSAILMIREEILDQMEGTA